MQKVIVSPSLLSANFCNLGESVEEIALVGADWVHLDIMDGNFVPNITFGPAVVGALRKNSPLFFDAHLMVADPLLFIPQFAASGADLITLHVESLIHVHRALQLIRSLNKKAGIALVPSTPVSAVKELLGEVDLVLVMTVNPGFGGQELIPLTIRKVAELSEIKRNTRYNFHIEVDGGINENTAREAVKSGADVLVTGSAFFASRDKREFLARLAGMAAPETA
jgi:ribulose-phosphate 3-epimerase